MLRHAAAAAFLLAALFARPSYADVAGPATVIDGDTVVVAGERIRLQAPTPPSCTRPAPPTGSRGVWTDLGRVAERATCAVGKSGASARPRPVRPAARRVLRRRRGPERADRARGLGARLPAILDGLPAGGISGQACRRRHLARRVSNRRGSGERSVVDLVDYAPRMAWPDQDPPSTDVLLHLNVPCSGGGPPAYLEIDKLP